MNRFTFWTNGPSPTSARPLTRLRIAFLFPLLGGNALLCDLPGGCGLVGQLVVFWVTASRFLMSEPFKK